MKVASLIVASLIALSTLGCIGARLSSPRSLTGPVATVAAPAPSGSLPQPPQTPANPTGKTIGGWVQISGLFPDRDLTDREREFISDTYQQLSGLFQRDGAIDLYLYDSVQDLRQARVILDRNAIGVTYPDPRRPRVHVVISSRHGIVHEMAHAFVAHTPGAYRCIPTWQDEGLAEVLAEAIDRRNWETVQEIAAQSWARYSLKPGDLDTDEKWRDWTHRVPTYHIAATWTARMILAAVPPAVEVPDPTVPVHRTRVGDQQVEQAVRDFIANRIDRSSC